MMLILLGLAAMCTVLLATVVLVLVLRSRHNSPDSGPSGPGPVSGPSGPGPVSGPSGPGPVSGPSGPGGSLPTPQGGKTVQLSPSDILAWDGKGQDKCKVSGDELQVTLQPKGFGSGGGIVLHSDLASGAQEIRVDFEVKYGNDASFQWVKGGKASVLGWEYGKGDASGGEWSETGASMRHMWRAEGAGSAYVYYGKKSSSSMTDMSDQVSGYAGIAHPTGTAGHSLWQAGESQNALPSFQAGVWTPVSMYGKLNTQGKSDGVLGISIGSETRLFSEMKWLDAPDGAGVGKVSATCWYGGSDESWSPTSPQVISFRKMQVAFK